MSYPLGWRAATHGDRQVIEDAGGACAIRWPDCTGVAVKVVPWRQTPTPACQSCGDAYYSIHRNDSTLGG